MPKGSFFGSLSNRVTAIRGTFYVRQRDSLGIAGFGSLDRRVGASSAVRACILQYSFRSTGYESSSFARDTQSRGETFIGRVLKAHGQTIVGFTRFHVSNLHRGESSESCSTASDNGALCLLRESRSK